MYNDDDIEWEVIGLEATEDDYIDDIDGFYDYLSAAY